jgi:hypothetical protein
LKGWFGLSQFWTLQVISPLPFILLATTIFGLSGNHHKDGYFRVTKLKQKSSTVTKSFTFIDQIIQLKVFPFPF